MSVENNTADSTAAPPPNLWLVLNIVLMLAWLGLRVFQLIDVRLHGSCNMPPREGMGTVIIVAIFLVLYLGASLLSLLALLIPGKGAGKRLGQGLWVWGLTTILWLGVGTISSIVVELGYCTATELAPVAIPMPASAR